MAKPQITGSVTPLAGKAPPPKIDTVTSLESVFTVGPSEWWRVNPDTLVRQQGLRVYAKMRDDDQVKAASQFKRDAIISRGWTFSYDDSSKLDPNEQERRVQLFNDIIEAYPGSFVDALNGVAAGREFGFSITEKVFSPVTLPTGEAMGINRLRFRDPSTFEFITDGWGTLTEFRQRAGGQLITLDLKDFIHYVHAPDVDPYFGRSDLRAAYKYWYMKGRMQDYWGLYMERLAGGFPVLTAKDSTAPRPGTSDYEAMKSILAGLRGAAGILVPVGMEFKLEQHSPTDAFERFITFADLGIAKALLVPNLMGVSHTGHTGGGTAGSGAGSQSQTQLEAFYWTLTSDQTRLEAVMNEQLFAPLAKLNFADGNGPTFAFKPLSDERLRWLVTTWAALIAGGAVVSTEEDEKFLRDLLDMPERDEDDTPLITPQQQMQQDLAEKQLEATTQAQRGAQEPDAVKTPQQQQKKFEAMEAEIAELRTLVMSRSSGDVNVNLPPHVGADTHPSRSGNATGAAGHVHVHAQLRSCTRAAFTRAVQRVNFSVIESKQMAATSQVTSDAAATIATAVDRLLSDGRMQKAVDDPSKIPTLKLSGDEVGKIKNVIKSGLVNSYVDGVAMARNELDRGGAKMKRAAFASVKNVAADYLDANAFRIGGNLSDATRAIIQQEMLNGVKAGDTISDIKTNIWDRLVSKGITSKEAVQGVETDEAINNALDDLWVDTEAGAAAYLTTLVRTNVFDAFNEGRFAEFTDPALGDFVAALEYSAILDDRTTEICLSLDGSVWDTDNPLWDTYRPPNHYNCRSILIGITQVDVDRGEWDGTESPPPSVEPQDGFGKGEKDGGE